MFNDKNEVDIRGRFMLYYKEQQHVKRRADNNKKKSSNDNTNLGRFVNNHKNRPSAEIFEFEIRAVMGADDFDKYVLLGGRKRKSLHVV